MKLTFLTSTLFIVLSVFLITATSCKDNSTPTPTPGSSNLRTVYKNGKIFITKATENDAKFAEAMVIEGDSILFVGSNTDALAMKGSNAKLTEVDLGGKLVLPGFHDVHIHPLEVGSDVAIFTVSDQDDLATLKKTITSKLNDKYFGSETEWLNGNGFGLDKVNGKTGSQTPREVLDGISSTRPIIVVEITSHSAWCNTKALELWADTYQPNIKTGSTYDFTKLDNPIGGAFMRKTDDNKTPNGIIFDNCANTMLALSITNTETADYNGFITTTKILNSYGITSISDARVYYKKNHDKTYQKLEADGKLTVRVNLSLWAYPLDTDTKLISDINSRYTFDLNKLVRINMVKIYADGITHNTTAAFNAGDYKKAYFGDKLGDAWPVNSADTHKGLNYLNETRIGALVKGLPKFDMHIHTIGYRAVTESLNAIQANQIAGQRHRLTHCENILTSDRARFKTLGVTMDAQVAGSFTLPSAWEWNLDQIKFQPGADQLVPIKSMWEAGANVTLSSDWDVSNFHPFKVANSSYSSDGTTQPWGFGGGFHNAVNRAPQNLTVIQAVKAYTINSAYVMRQESIVGTLEKGKKADFIVLSQDLFTIDKVNIKNTEVERTIFNGVEVFKK